MYAEVLRFMYDQSGVFKGNRISANLRKWSQKGNINLFKQRKPRWDTAKRGVSSARFARIN